MTSPSWDPAQYERFAAERARPYADLVARVPHEAPERVVDLGCGPGTATATLTRRWPGASITGIDSSADMISAAQRHATDLLTFEQADLRTWHGSADVIVSNATLQWVPGHEELFEAWAGSLTDHGVLAFQVPAPAEADGGYTAIFKRTATSPAWRDRLHHVTEKAGPQGSSPVRTPGEYVEALANAGFQTIDVWETTYHHVLQGDDPVVEWFLGTGLRPYLDALDGAAKQEFTHDIAKGLREQYPRRPFGTVLPFHRIFAVGHRP